MKLEVGALIEGKVSGITNFGVFLDLENSKTGMVHISEVSNDFVKNIRDYVSEGQIVKVKVIKISEKGEIALSMKNAINIENIQKFSPTKNSTSNNFKKKPFKKQNIPLSFEDMLSMFKHTSEEKMSDLKRNTDSKRGGNSRKGSQK